MKHHLSQCFYASSCVQLTESLEESNGQNGKSRVGVLPMKYSSRRIYIYIRSIYTLILSYTDHVYTYMYINNIYIYIIIYIYM